MDSISTVPLDALDRCRTSTGKPWSRGGMKSVTRTTPLKVVQVVSRISESPWYCLADLAAPGNGPVSHGRADPPVPVVLVAEQGGEAGVGVESRQAQPVNGAVAADQRGGLHVPDQCVVLDQARHRSLPSGADRLPGRQRRDSILRH